MIRHLSNSVRVSLLLISPLLATPDAHVEAAVQPRPPVEAGKEPAPAALPPDTTTVKTAAAAESAPQPSTGSAPDTTSPAPREDTASPPLPVISVATPEPKASVARSFHTHDGFYTRVSFGLGMLGASVHNSEDDLMDRSGDGDSLELDVLVGGSPAKGMALGGALFLSSSASMSLDAGSERFESDGGVGILGAFIDGYPDPEGGFHLGGALGLAQVTADTAGNAGFEKASGLGFAAFIGYDAWVGDEWSLGGLLRLTATRAKDRDTEGKPSVSTTSVGVMLTAVYH